MSKKFKLFDVSADSLDHEIGWGICILCQPNTGEDLTFPGRNNRFDKNAGYSKLAQNLEEFEQLGQVPRGLNISSLNEGSGVKETLINRAAGWHRSCYLEFSSSRLDRARKKPSTKNNELPTLSPVKTRTKKECFSTETCIFCGSIGTRYHVLSTVSTQHCSQEIYESAKKLKDTQLLAKLAGVSDSMAHTLKATYHNKCRLNYLRRVKKLSAAPKTSDKGQIHGLALAGLVSSMKAIRQYSDEPPIFKMAALSREYSDRLSELGLSCDVHSTRLQFGSKKSPALR